jgi:hypothetical protein
MFKMIPSTGILGKYNFVFLLFIKIIMLSVWMRIYRDEHFSFFSMNQVDTYNGNEPVLQSTDELNVNLSIS